MDFNKIQNKWQERWEKEKVFESCPDSGKKKFYCLEMFPYPSGYLHMGHVRNYSIGDSFARYKRMRGFNVLYPMGYDAFGLPAENAAIKKKADPAEWTYKNIDGIKAQQKVMGLSYDWGRQVNTCDPEYYKWNQWIFLKLFEKGLAYKRKSFVNWCPDCNTVLANEQVHDGKCWRCSAEVEQKDLDQWFFKITDYAEELLDDIGKLENWPERVKVMQKNWIGKSRGVELYFDVVDEEGRKVDTISTFTTRPDTVYGITYLVLAVEHPKVLDWTEGTEYEEEVKNFIREQKKRSVIDRTAEGKEKNGVFIGKYFINPFTGEKCPLWIADYALYEYGTGAVMAVPTHDQRDFDFARKYSLPMKVVISPPGFDLNPDKMSRAYVDDGTLINSGDFDGMHNKDAIEEIGKFAEKKGWGKITTNYKLKDWLISRQRYWGTPIPIVYCDKCGIVPVPEDDLPVVLPKDVKFTGRGNPLETSEGFSKCECPKCRGEARRETDTMDTFVDSSWYFLRYCSPHENNLPFEKKQAEYWMPVDQYIGGIEHACMHLIYARFFTKSLRDLGLIDFDEPFASLLCQGMVIKDGAKMSKSVGNVVDPMEIIEKYGTDTARLFILFAALPEKELDWSDKGVEGAYRFLKRVSRLVEEGNEKTNDEISNREKRIIGKLHSTIRDVTGHIEGFQFSLAIGKLMELTNDIYKYKSNEINKSVYDEICKKIALMISPFAPHLAEEMWEILGEEGFISDACWPEFDEAKIDLRADALEEMIYSTIADIKSVQELIKIKKPKKIKLIFPAEWKYEFFRQMKKELSKTFNTGEIIKAIMKDSNLKTHGALISKLIPKIVKDPSKMPEIVLDQKSEISNFKENKDIFEKEFNAEISVAAEDQSKESKAGSAMPGKPAIILE